MERLAYEEAGDLYGMALQALDAVDDVDPDEQARRCISRAATRCSPPATSAAARGAIDALEVAARGSERLAAWYTTYEGLLAVLAEPDRLTEIVQSIGAAADAMHAVGDLTGEAKAHYVHAAALERLGPDRRGRACARRRARGRARRRRPPARRHDPRRGATRGPVGTEPGHARERPLPRRRARAAHHRRARRRWRRSRSAARRCSKRCAAASTRRAA